MYAYMGAKLSTGYPYVIHEHLDACALRVNLSDKWRKECDTKFKGLSCKAWIFS
jgi:hypothetical protein